MLKRAGIILCISQLHHTEKAGEALALTEKQQNSESTQQQIF